MKRVSFIVFGIQLRVVLLLLKLNENGSYQLIYQQKESIRLSENMWEEK